MVEVAGSRLTLPPERKFASLESVQSYVDALLALRWIRTRWATRAVVPVVVRQRARQSRAQYERLGGVVAVPLHRGGAAWALRELVVLHEVSHHLAPDDEPAHGSDFTGRMVELVESVIGLEAAFLLRVTLLDVGAQIG